ncbi:hypothetical protein BDR05DRAFT_980136 [Suillus weaverae]|nr:hypothetical protein BDR05DRAFT_980136 [Suillus weaverae]
MQPDHYGLFRTYPDSFPSYSPDEITSLAHLSDSTHFANAQQPAAGSRPWWSGFGTSMKTQTEDFFVPFLSATTYRLMCWFHGGSTMKSLAELDHLFNEVILADDFDKADLQGFRASRELEHLDNYQGDPEDIRSSFSMADGWIETSVKICLPADGVKHPSEESAPEFAVPGLFYRCPLEVLKTAFHEASAEQFHLTPFETSFQPSPNEPVERSKYVQGKPSCFAAHHLAYIPKVTFDKPATAEVLTHCRHELMQAIWLLLMDDDFMHAYEFGIVIEFLDGICRRVFPRFFTYSADYPEKTLLACIKFLAKCPCPRCLVPKAKIGELGTRADRRRRERDTHKDSHGLRSTIKRVRDWLYVKGTNISSVFVKRLLGPDSLIATASAFSTRLAQFGFNFYSLFIPDLLHEFELRVWKAIFTHILQILYAYRNNTIQALNKRYQRVPTFGRDMKRLAARDFEDLLQVTIIEEAARGRRKARQAAKQGPSQSAAPTSRRGTDGPKIRHFNFETYKLHALGDYVDAIHQFGTTDNFTTQPGKLEHHRVKRFYPRVSKAKFTSGIAKQERRERILFKMAQAEHNDSKLEKGKSTTVRKPGHTTTAGEDASFHIPFEAAEPLAYSDPMSHYHISNGTRYHLNLPQWLIKHANDPALYDFLPQLKDHLLSRILGREYDGDETEFSAAEHAQVLLINDRIFQHKVIRVNYTTYDLRHSQDSLNPRTHADVMVLGHEDDDTHPYWYARILSMFHTNIIYRGGDAPSFEPQQMDFLWVRWFGHDPNNYQSGWKAKRLHRLGIHLIPAFAYGHTDLLLPPSIARPLNDKDKDWKFFYINIFVDRDMMMRFCGGGVGHKSTHEATAVFLEDCDPLDEITRNDSEEEFEDLESGINEGAQLSGSTSGATQNQATGDEDEDNIKSEMDEYGYVGLDEEEEATDEEGEEEQLEADGLEEANDEVGPEDGEDDVVDEYEGYAEL